ncbi:G-type lectin S-receptor-like serine/threonine-protein kinase [Hibiscus syriacus]|uniref:G-type lectin S-receptor-like serine/threonine-protein kinase n=1 Tax=Hibiscus syriacus TaxID=106335 RepID=A0A6A3BMG8_HIBSY|nr:G-type lectin S-receptor-like serine/threonine-protein kinase [Hibiscus syriacus]
MSESGNFILYTANNRPAWQSFAHPTDTLLPNQPLTVSLELTSSKSVPHGSYYALKMLQQPTSLTLALTYNLPDTFDHSPEGYSNYSYWASPDISNVTGDVVAVLDEAGSFGVVYGQLSNGAIYVYKNDGDYDGLSSATNKSNDNDVNGSRQWVPEWAAVSNPCDIAGICGNGICNLDRSKTNASCTCLPEIGPQTSRLQQYSKPTTISLIIQCWQITVIFPRSQSVEMLGLRGIRGPWFDPVVKVRSNVSLGPGGDRSGSGSIHDKILVLRIVLSMGAPLNFGYRDLQGNFSQLLGTGGFGSVYKGSLSDGTLIAVKKLDRVFPHGEKEFITEVNTIGSMHHMNMVRLCGYCSEGSHRMLYWPTRFNIVIAIARGIAYFDEQCRNRIIHCDIKPENILLDENFCPKVSDFELAKLMGREHSHVVTMVRGTRGYLAPEWVSNRLTVKADVYSYGILLLDILGGRRNLDISYDAEDFFYPGWACKEMTNGTPMKVADKRLGSAVDEEQLTRALKVAFWCIQDEVIVRPSMGEVVKMLEGSMDINAPPMPQTVSELVEEGL